MDFDTLMKRIADVDALLEKKLVTAEKAEGMKQRLVTAYENSEIPEYRMPKDVAHLPGRMIEGVVDLGKAIARGSGATYKALEEQEDRAARNGKSKNIFELYDESIK